MVLLLLLLLHHLDSRLLRMPAATEVQDRLTRLCTGLPVDDRRSSLGRSESKATTAFGSFITLRVARRGVAGFNPEAPHQGGIHQYPFVKSTITTTTDQKNQAPISICLSFGTGNFSPFYSPSPVLSTLGASPRRKIP